MKMKFFSSTSEEFFADSDILYSSVGEKMKKARFYYSANLLHCSAC